MLLGRIGRVAAAICVSIPVFLISNGSLGADIYTLSTSKYLSSPDLFVTLSGRLISGNLDRKDSSFFKLRDLSGKVVSDSVASFSNDGFLSGYEGEASVGKWFGPLAYEFVVGGVSVSSEASEEGRVAVEGGQDRLLILGAPYADQSVSLKWSSAGQFDLEDVAYRNAFSREEVYAGARMTVLRDSWAPGKDAPRFQPMAYVSFGDVKVSETFGGATGGSGSDSQNISWSYDNSVVSSFIGVGGGVGTSGLLAEIAQVRIGYFGGLRGGFEFQQATGSSNWTYRQIKKSVSGCSGKNCSDKSQKVSQTETKNWASPTKELTASETVLALHAEAGLAVALMTGVDVELGARLRRFDAPQVVVDGENDAFIQFETSQELSGFLGLKAEF
jgi:hypothetical protein